MGNGEPQTFHTFVTSNGDLDFLASVAQKLHSASDPHAEHRPRIIIRTASPKRMNSRYLAAIEVCSVCREVLKARDQLLHWVKGQKEGHSPRLNRMWRGLTWLGAVGTRGGRPPDTRTHHKCASRAPIISALPSPRVKLATLGSQRARVLARAKKGRGGGPGEEFLNGGEAYEIEFGKPAAPAEYWGKIANDSTSGMMEASEASEAFEKLQKGYASGMMEASEASEAFEKLQKGYGSGMMEALGLGSSGVALMAGLFNASEEDAISTKAQSY
eukprot:gene11774-14925_t